VGLDVAKAIEEDEDERVASLDVGIPSLARSFFKCETNKLTEDLNNTIAKTIRLRYKDKKGERIERYDGATSPSRSESNEVVAGRTT
jgi:hypothetical protein